MAHYYCVSCDKIHDGDYIPCVEHPDGSNDLICDEAAQDIEEKLGEEL